MGKIIDWLDDRAGIRALFKLAVEEHVPGGARFRYVFGSVLTFLFMQQIVLGVLLATYYSPSATDAWASTAYIQDRVTAGWFLRGLHHHGSSAMVVLTLLHMIQVFIAGAYKKPRELNWWIGLLMGGAVLAFALTGYLLPWDQKGYWATQVATGIMGTLPLIGDPMQHLLQGGTEYGNLTITRFYAIHVFVLPAALGGMMLAHVYLFRRHGVTPPARLSEQQLERRAQPFWPNQLFIDVVAMAATAAALVAMTYQTHGAELFAPADPASNFVARPEWYFLFLFQLLKYFEGPLAIIATVIIPGGVATFLFALPFVDRAQSRQVKKRIPVVVGMATLMAGVVALTGLAAVADANNEEYQKGLTEAHASADEARRWAAEGVLPGGGNAVFENDPEFKTRQLFEDSCGTCHELDGKGGEEAPSFSAYGGREWLYDLVREPSSTRYFGGTKSHRTMETYAANDLPSEELDMLVEYMLSLREEPGDAINEELAKEGEQYWADQADCSGCHEIESGQDGSGAPTMQGRGSRAWVRRVIEDSSLPDLFGEDAEMPKFAGKLSQDEIAALADLIVEQGLPTKD